MPALINTILMVFLSLIIAVPFGVFTAIYLVEYTKSDNKLVGIIRVTAETLSGIPSIVYGLFGFLFFVTTLKWNFAYIRSLYRLYYGASADYAHHRRSLEGGTQHVS